MTTRLKLPVIAFEGVDLTGKTTHAHAVADWLNTSGVSALYARAPGQTDIGKRLRNIVLNYPETIKDPYTRQLLFLADHNELISQVIIPATRAGTIMILDRFLDSTEAYGVGGLSLDYWRIRSMIEDVVPQGVASIDLPTYVIQLAIPESIRFARLQHRATVHNDKADHFPPDFYSSVAKHYRIISEREWRRDFWITVDATQDMPTVYAACQTAIRAILKKYMIEVQ